MQDSIPVLSLKFLRGQYTLLFYSTTLLSPPVTLIVPMVAMKVMRMQCIASCVCGAS